MEQPYTSIRQEILRKPEEQLPFIENVYGVKTIGIFGSVSMTGFRDRLIHGYFSVDTI